MAKAKDKDASKLKEVKTKRKRRKAGRGGGRGVVTPLSMQKRKTPVSAFKKRERSLPRKDPPSALPGNIRTLRVSTIITGHRLLEFSTSLSLINVYVCIEKRKRGMVSVTSRTSQWVFLLRRPIKSHRIRITGRISVACI